MTTTESALAYRKQKISWRKRRGEIKALREKGWTFEKIGARFRISRQRAYAIYLAEDT